MEQNARIPALGYGAVQKKDESQEGPDYMSELTHL